MKPSLSSTERVIQSVIMVASLVGACAAGRATVHIVYYHYKLGTPIVIDSFYYNQAQTGNDTGQLQRRPKGNFLAANYREFLFGTV